MTTRHIHIHIAILDTDVPVPTVYAARGLYSSQFRVLLQSAATRLNQSADYAGSSSFQQQIKIYTSAYDVVGGSYPALGMLRKTANVPTSTSASTSQTENVDDDDDDIFRPIDAILITGSAASAYYQGEQYAWIAELQKFIRRVWTRHPRVKMFGSCFGHQIIAQALFVNSDDEKETRDSDLDVQVEACPMGYEIGIHPITLNPEFTATPLGKTFSKGLQIENEGKLHMQLIHGDRVIGSRVSAKETEKASITKTTTSRPLTDLPAPWLNLGSTQLSPIQGLYHPGRVLTYQGHFEFDVFVNMESVLEFGRRASWERPIVDQYLQQVNGWGGYDDSNLAAEVVVRFLAGDGGGHEDCVSLNVQDVGQINMKMAECLTKEEVLVRSMTKTGLVTPPDEMSIHV